MNMIIIWVLGFAILALILKVLIPSNSEKAADRLMKHELRNKKEEIVKSRITANQDNHLRNFGVILEKRFAKKTLDEDQKTSETKKLLLEAGFGNSYHLYLYSFSQIIGAIIGFAGGFLYTTTKSPEGMMAIVPLILGVVLGLYLPIMYVKNRRNSRTAEIRKMLPDALEMLALCNEASMTIDMALKKIANELSEKYPVISNEFAIIGVELSLLESRHKAFDGFYKRMPLDEVRSFVSSINQAEKTGTPIAGALRLLAQEMRKDRLSKIQQKIEALSGKLVLPLALFFLLPMLAFMMLPIFSKVDLNSIGS